MESYAHRFAKTILADWLVVRHNLHVEHPVALKAHDGDSLMWGLNWHDWRNVELSQPRYEDLISEGFDPVCIFDVAVFDRGYNIRAALEIVHKHDITKGKLENFGYIRREAVRRDLRPPRLYRIRADYILDQIGAPSRIEMERVA